MTKQQELIPHLFRTEYRKIVSVLCRHFGFDQIETAEDIAGDTFLTASETWELKGVPPNPTAWLYHVAKNKAKNYGSSRISVIATRYSGVLQDRQKDDNLQDQGKVAEKGDRGFVSHSNAV